MIVIYLLAMIAISFIIKELDGPFDILAKTRNWLMLNKFVGVFFYKLFECYFCCGFWSGLIVYLLQMDVFHLREFILFGLAGALISLVFNKFLEISHNE
jgi:hypothetical protein